MSACLTALLLAVTSLTHAESMEGWYQVDVILFKPTRTSLDAESWPEFEPSYPADVIAITEPRAFNLSQLEQLEPVAELEAQEPLEPALGRDEFLFESEGNSQRNRRLLESLAAEREQPEQAMIDNGQDATSSGETPDSGRAVMESPLQDPAELPDADPFGAGTLAYMRTTDESTLNSILRSLNWSSRFKVLSHDSWVQPINAEPTFILVQTGQRYDDRFEVEGTLSFRRSRYLHVQTDLWYTRFEPRTSSVIPYRAAVASELSDEMLSRYKDLVAVERQRDQYYTTGTHRMVQSRRMRSSELHYLDHPLFGVIVRISRYEPEMPEAESL